MVFGWSHPRVVLEEILMVECLVRGSPLSPLSSSSICAMERTTTETFTGFQSQA